MPECYGASRALNITLITDWVWTELGAVAADPRSEAPPARIGLEVVELAVADVAGGATQITVCLARNVAGWPRLTPGNASGAVLDLEIDEGDATLASASQILDRPYVRLAGDEGLYLGLKLDAGTATCDATVVWSRW